MELTPQKYSVSSIRRVNLPVFNHQIAMKYVSDSEHMVET